MITNTEAKLIAALLRDHWKDGRVRIYGPRTKKAARNLEKRELIRWIDVDAPDNSGRGGVEIEWAKLG